MYQKSKTQIVFRWIVYFLEILIFYSAERLISFNFGSFRLCFFLLIPAFVSISLFESEYVGLFFGAFSGVLIDISMGIGIGPCAAFLGFIGYIIGVFSNYFIKSGVLSELLFGIIALTYTEFWKLFLEFRFERNLDLQKVLNNMLLPSFGVSIFIMILVFYLNRSVSYRLGGKAASLN